MNALVEKGLRAYLAQQLAAEEVTIGEGDEAYTALMATVADCPVSLHRNVSTDQMPNEPTWVIVNAHEIRRVAGKLHLATILLAVCSRWDLDDGPDEDDHAAIVKAVRDCFPDMPALYNARAAAATEEETEAAQGALDAALLKLQACSAALAEHAQVAISDTSAWFVESARDGIMKESKRWEAITPIKLAIQEL